LIDNISETVLEACAAWGFLAGSWGPEIDKKFRSLKPQHSAAVVQSADIV
jgi:hypothetical protein